MLTRSRIIVTHLIVLVNETLILVVIIYKACIIFCHYSIYDKLLGERSGGFIRLSFVSEFAFSLFQFQLRVPYGFYSLLEDEQEFKLGDVDE